MRNAKEGGVLRRYLRRRKSIKVPTHDDLQSSEKDPVICASFGSFIDLEDESLSSFLDDVDDVDDIDGDDDDHSDFDLEHEPLRSDLNILDVHPSDEHWMIQMGHFFVDPVGWFMEVTTPRPTDPKEFMKQIGGAPSSDDESTTSLSEDSEPSVPPASDDDTTDSHSGNEISDRIANADFEQFVLERMSQKRPFPGQLPPRAMEV